MNKTKIIQRRLQENEEQLLAMTERKLQAAQEEKQRNLASEFERERRKKQYEAQRGQSPGDHQAKRQSIVRSASSEPRGILAANDGARAKMLQEQLRRNEALKKSIERLEQYKQRQWEEEGEIKDLISSRKRNIANESFDNPAKIPVAERLPGRQRSDNGLAQTKVFEAWRKAHEANQKRYRILQEGIESPAYSGAHMETVIQRRRCRRCQKPIQERKFLRYT